jgi:putative phosphoribosyl transferase
MLFTDRRDAGHQLAQRLEHLRGHDVVVVALPRGGVPVGAEVADHLGAPLDVIIVRKVGVPFQPELAMGAIGEGGVRIMNEAVIRSTRVTAEEWTAVERQESAELERRAREFRKHRVRVPLTGRIVVIVDDGIATGSTARAACQVARAEGASRVVLAVPVAPEHWERSFRDEADELVCIATPEPFQAVGRWYRDFAQVTDDEVEALLDEGRSAGGPKATIGEVRIPVDDVELNGHLDVPAKSAGIVVFAHGSGSSRHSPRNQYVAKVLTEAGIGTLLFDLLTEREESDRANVFDIELLARRLTAVTKWLQGTVGPDPPAIGYFGASTGAGAALWAASEPGIEIAAIVSRGGRPDLAGPRLAGVRAPTLLIVGSDDHVVLDLNREAQAQMRCETQLVVVPGASHLFAEPGTLEAAATAARDWFSRHFAPPQ